MRSALSSLVSHEALRGLLLCSGIVVGAQLLVSTTSIAHHGIGTLVLALTLGLLIGNLPLFEVGQIPQLQTGLRFARSYCLRSGIALYGLGLSIDGLMRFGWSAPLSALIVVASTLWLAGVLGRRLGISPGAASLIGLGSAICGAAAIAAAQEVIDPPADSAEVGSAIACVVVFGTLGMYLLPLLYPYWQIAIGGDSLRSEHLFGLLIGLSVHELGHVIGAASAIGGEAEAAALVEKMLRVTMLAPVLLFLTSFKPGVRSGERTTRISIPPFLIGFVVSMLIASSPAVPHALKAAGTDAAQFLLALGLAALGIATRWQDMRRAPLRLWLLATLLWAHLLIVSTLCALWMG